MGSGDLQIQVWQRRLPCIVEPALVLARPDGAALALGLARAFEAWLTRSFWTVLDASELLARPHPAPAGPGIVEPDTRALADWLALRESTDAASWTLRWLGDCAGDSQARDGGAIELIDRYEGLLAALHDRLAAAPGGRGELPWCPGLDRAEAAADALALSAALGGALLLCAGPAGQAVPVPVAMLQRIGIEPDECGHDDRSLLDAERAVVREAIAAAGLAPALRDVPGLAAVHAMAAPAGHGDAADPWEGARAWWYRL